MRRAKPAGGHHFRVDVASARQLSRRYLANALPQRWAHVRATARVARRIGPRVLPAEEQDLLVSAAFLHDIGCAGPLVVSGFHPLDGARFLHRAGGPTRLCALVAHHSAAAVGARLCGLAEQLAEFPDEATDLRDALWFCDMSVDPAGRAVTFDQRIAGIRARHAEDSFAVRALDSGALEACAAAVDRVRQRLVPRKPQSPPVRRLHAADLRIEAWADSREACIAEAVNALVGSFVGPARLAPSSRSSFQVTGGSDAELLQAVLGRVISGVLDRQEVPVATMVSATPGGLEVSCHTVNAGAILPAGAIPKSVSRRSTLCRKFPSGWWCAARIDV